MAKIDRMARWIAAGILAERGVEKTPESMAALMPVSYVFAEGVIRALAELTAEMSDELAGATAVILCPVPAGDFERQLADFEMGPGVPTWHPEHGENDII